MNNTKINIYKIVLQVCEKFNGTEQYIKERIEELSNEKKILAKEVTFIWFITIIIFKLFVKILQASF